MTDSTSIYDRPVTGPTRRERKMSETKDVFPITDYELDKMHDLDWESGYGCRTQFDWFRSLPGKAVWIEDDTLLMEQWLIDLAHVRKERLNGLKMLAGVELYDALETLLPRVWDWMGKAEPGLIATPETNAAVAALAKARGESQ